MHQKREYGKKVESKEGIELGYQDKVLRSKVIGTPNETFLSKATTLRHRLDFIEGLKTPWFEGIGIPNSDEENDKRINKLTLLFWNNLQVDSNGNLYPLATHDNIAIDGTELGTYSLAWEGDRGLYNQLWKEFIDLYLNGAFIDYTANFDAADVFSFDEAKKFKANYMEFVPDSVEINLSDRIQTKIKCVRQS